MGGLKDVVGSNLISIVGKSAPLLATVLGSPLAGIALSLIASLFGADPKNIGDLVSKIQNDEEANIKLKELELKHQETLVQIASNDFETETKDKQDARKYGYLYRDFLLHMSYLVTLGFFAALFLLFIPLTISEAEKNLLSMLVGMLASKWQTIIDFFYGSSRFQRQQFNKKN